MPSAGCYCDVGVDALKGCGNVIMKKAAIVFAVIAVLLSDIMCALVAFAYRDMLCGIEHLGYSAPASVAFLYAIPFLIGIIICVVLAVILYRKSKR